jgi:transcriptional regulator with XRE-family HTH domain
MNTFDNTKFGLRLRELRSQIGLRHVDIEQIFNISSETLRKIEGGKSTPRIETLAILSNAYCVNLIQLYDSFKTLNSPMSHYDQVDKAICDLNIDKLELITSSFTSHSNNLVNTYDEQIELQQFNLFVEAVKESFESNNKSKKNALIKLISAIKIREANFQLEVFHKYVFFQFELRLLIVIGVILAELKEINQSSDILYFVLKRFDQSNHASHYEKQLILKILNNLSYNEHILSNYKNANDYATSAITFAIENNLIYILEDLYFRKAVAHFRLGYTDYLEYFNRSISILEIRGAIEKMNIFIKTGLEKYGFCANLNM